MVLDIVKVGYLRTNCYLLKKEGKVLVVDPGDEYLKIQNKIVEQIESQFAYQLNNGIGRAFPIKEKL